MMMKSNIQSFRVLVTLLLWTFFSLKISAQELLFFYSVGHVSGTTPYVQIDVDDKNIGTIGLNEYASSFSNYSSNHRISLKRRGLDGIELTSIPQGREIRIFEIRLAEARWSSREKMTSEVSNDILRLCETIYSDEASKVKQEVQTKGIISTSGIPPSQGTSLLILTNGAEPCCQISSDLLGELTSMGFQKNYRVIDRETLDRILDEQKMQMTGLVNSDFAVEAGQLTGAQQVVISQCYCNNEDAVYSIKIIDCSTAEVSSSALFSLGSPLELGERTGEVFSPE